MAIEGPLRELGIHDVFQLLDLSRKTGALRVTSELRHNEGTVYFDNGVVVSAEIRSNPHPLGALLLRTGKITEADFDRARDMQQRQGDKRRLGELLAALGVITKGEGGELDLLPPEWEVLALIDGERSVRGLATELGRSDFEVAKTLFGLESAGVIVLVDPGTAKRGRPSAAGDMAEQVAKAERALQAKDLDAARAAAEQAGSMQPHDATIHLLLGRIHLAQGHASAAAEELRRALRLDPLLAAAHRQLGFALVSMGRFGEAVQSWDQWERLARTPEEESQRAEVQRARDAAKVFSHG